MTRAPGRTPLPTKWLTTLVLVAAAAAAGCTDQALTAPDSAQFAEKAPSAASATGETVSIASLFADGMCLAIEGSAVQLASCDSGDDQTFSWGGDGPIGFAGSCVATADESGEDGTTIVVESCDGASSQDWTLDGSEIVGIGGKCLDVYGAQAEAGTPIILWPCHGRANQEWAVRSGDDGSDPQPPSGGGLVPYDNSSPVVYVNDAAVDMYTDEYLMALASAGDIQLEGIVTQSSLPPYNPYVEPGFLEEAIALRDETVQRALSSDFTGIPAHTAGDGDHLERPASGSIEDTQPLNGAGTQVVLDEARQATPDDPLVVVVGGNLTVVADAYLLDPSIADRMIVAWLGGNSSNMGDYNGFADAWAAEIVLKRLQLVAFPAGRFEPEVPKDRLTELPDTPLRAWMIDKENPTNALPAGKDADGPPAIALMRSDYVLQVKRVAFGGTFDRDGHQVPVYQDDPDGTAIVVTSASTGIATEEWWRALDNPDAYDGSGDDSGDGSNDGSNGGSDGGSTAESGVIESLHADGMCLEIRGGAAVLGTCTGDAAQTFSWSEDLELKVGDRCLATDTFSGAKGERVVAADCLGTGNQQWSLNDQGQIVGIRGLCLDVSGARTDDGAPVIVWSCHDSSNQRWDPQLAAPGG